MTKIFTAKKSEMEVTLLGVYRDLVRLFQTNRDLLLIDWIEGIICDIQDVMVREEAEGMILDIVSEEYTALFFKLKAEYPDFEEPLLRRECEAKIYFKWYPVVDRLFEKNGRALLKERLHQMLN